MKAELAATVLRLPDGRELGYAEYGDPKGTPVFGFHGTPGSRLQLAPVAEAARRLGVRCIAPDRPGSGLSDYDADRRIVDWPGDVAAIADYLGLERFGVLGISGGGPYAAVCAHALGPRLLGAAIVSGVAPLHDDDALAGAMPANRLIFRLARRSALLVWPLFAAMVWLQRLAPGFFTRAFARQLPEPDRRALERPEIQEIFRRELVGGSRAAARAAAQEMALFARPWGFRLEEIEVPVQLWQGDLDRNVPAAHARLQAERIPKAELHGCPGEGHMLFLDRADEILRAAAGLGP